MTKRVKTIDVVKPISECVKLMEDHNIGSVIVVDHESPVGIFTERDLIKTIAGKNGAGFGDESGHVETPDNDFFYGNSLGCHISNGQSEHPEITCR